MKPYATDNENRIRYLQSRAWGNFIDSRASLIIDHFSVPVHEDITHRIYGCPLEPAADCTTPLPRGTYAPWPVLFELQPPTTTVADSNKIKVPSDRIWSLLAVPQNLIIEISTDAIVTSRLSMSHRTPLHVPVELRRDGRGRWFRLADAVSDASVRRSRPLSVRT